MMMASPHTDASGGSTNVSTLPSAQVIVTPGLVPGSQRLTSTASWEVPGSAGRDVI